MSSLFGIGGGGNVGAAGGFYSYSIDQSLRFNDNDSAYLSRTFASAGNQKTWTWSGWVKRGNIGSNQDIFSPSGASPNQKQFRIGSTGTITFYHQVSGTITAQKWTTQLLRDVSAWYHIVLEVDTTNATAADRIKIYVNGDRVTSFDTSTDPALNADLVWNSATNHFIGNNNSQYFDGYMAEVNFIDGTALDPTSFGETINGIWVPKAYSGSYGTNGFYLSYADSSAIGDDLSGNTNDFTANNLAASDVVLDSPTNNWCTFNPLDQNDISGLSYPTTYSEGNLKLAQGSGFNNRKATFGLTSGKWYWEIKINDGSPGSFFGVSKSTGDARGALDNDEAMIALVDGDLYTNGATSSYGTAFSNGDVCILAVDMDAGKFWAGRNGTWFASGDPAAGTNEGKSGLASELFPSVSLADAENCDVNFGQNGTFNGTKTAGGNSDGNGLGDFLYTVPSGFLAICASNLPEAAIGPNSDEQADDYFNTVLYTGDGSTSNAITGVGFQPDWTWIKRTDVAHAHHITDSVRGVQKDLRSDSTAAETIDNVLGFVKSFDTDGFTVSVGSTSGARTNTDGKPHVSWNWKAGGTAVSNTDGSITSSVSANQDAGFSVVSWTGNGTSGATIGHGLSSAPELLFSKTRSSAGLWCVYAGPAASDAETDYLRLDGTDSLADDARIWNDTKPTASVFSVGSGTSHINTSSVTHVTYCFHSVDGFSKVGSYVGNGSTDGTFVYTGFRPAWIMIKRTDTTGSWNIADAVRSPFNEVDEQLQANLTNAESTTFDFDFTSNGFKARTTDGARNASGGTYIYLAFAEMPFKYANAR